MATLIFALLTLHTHFTSADKSLSGALGSVAPCAAGCFKENIAAQRCSDSDFKCICPNTNLLQHIQLCANTTCTNDPYNDKEGFLGSIDLLSGLCQINGYNLDLASNSSIEQLSSTSIPENPLIRAEAGTTLEVQTDQTTAVTDINAASIETVESTIFRPVTATVVETQNEASSLSTGEATGISAIVLGTSEVIIATSIIPKQSSEGTYTSEPSTITGAVATTSSYITVESSASEIASGSTSIVSESVQSSATEVTGSNDSVSSAPGTIYSYTPTTRATVYVSSSSSGMMSNEANPMATTGGSYSSNDSYMGVEPFMGAATKATLSWHTLRAVIGLCFLFMLGGLVDL